MTREKKRNVRWLLQAGAAAAGALMFAAVLFLGVPPLLDTGYSEDMLGVDPLGWKPELRMDLCPADSLTEVMRAGAGIFLRYDPSAPDTLALVMNSVIKDGSERQDTLEVVLFDPYGHPAGRRGYVMSETEAPLHPNAGADECRLVELYPAETTRGIHTVGIVLKHKQKK